jgi:hypothetical protein
MGGTVCRNFLCSIILITIAGSYSDCALNPASARGGKNQRNAPIPIRDHITIARRYKRGFPPYAVVYKRGNQTVSEHEIDRPILRDDRTGTSAVQVPMRIYIVDRNGFVQDTLEFNGVYLRTMPLKQGLLIYDSGFRYLARFNPTKHENLKCAHGRIMFNGREQSSLALLTKRVQSFGNDSPWSKPLVASCRISVELGSSYHVPPSFLGGNRHCDIGVDHHRAWQRSRTTL